MSGTRTPEGRVKEKVRKLLTRYDFIHTFWPVQAGYGSPTLDCLGSRNGRSFAIECKAPGKRPTPRQELTIADMRKGGYMIFVVGSETADDVIYPYSGMRELAEWLYEA